MPSVEKRERYFIGEFQLPCDYFKMKKVSFIIVALNAEKALPFSLGSLTKQDYPHNNIEVILVDGMSKDDTKRVMLDFKEKESSFARVVVLDNPKRYLACGWNVALREGSKG